MPILYPEMMKDFDWSKLSSSRSQDHSATLDAISKSLLNRAETSPKHLFLGTFKQEAPMADTFPISVESITLNHKGGTKSYHATIAKNVLGHSLVIFRWGKKGAFGVVDTFQFDTGPEADQVLEKKISEKMRGSYSADSMNDPTPKTAANIQDLQRMIGRAVFTKLKPSDLTHLVPSANTEGLRDTGPNQFNDDGTENQEFLALQAARVREAALKAEEETRQRLEKEQRQLEEEMSSITNFGAF